MGEMRVQEAGVEVRKTACGEEKVQVLEEQHTHVQRGKDTVWWKAALESHEKWG